MSSALRDLVETGLLCVRSYFWVFSVACTVN